jgi:transposase-like protein
MSQRYKNEIKSEAILDVLERKQSYKYVAEQHAINEKTLYRWVSEYRKQNSKQCHCQQEIEDLQLALQEKKRELKEANEQIKTLQSHIEKVRERKHTSYEAIKRQMGTAPRTNIRELCRTYNLHPSGFYKWLKDVWVVDFVDVTTATGTKRWNIVFDSRSNMLINEPTTNDVTQTVNKKVLNHVQYPLIIYVNASNTKACLLAAGGHWGEIPQRSPFKWSKSLLENDIQSQSFSTDEEVKAYLKTYVYRR